jgi:uncharacterized protein (DUF427 family)
MARQCLDKDIRITPHAGRVTVTFAGKIVASSTAALDLDEPGSQLRVYFPRADVASEFLADSATHSTCPFKGEASYHSLQSGEVSAPDAVWYYPDPCPLVEPIRDHLAFWGSAIRYDTALA